MQLLSQLRINLFSTKKMLSICYLFIVLMLICLSCDISRVVRLSRSFSLAEIRFDVLESGESLSVFVMVCRRIRTFVFENFVFGEIVEIVREKIVRRSTYQLSLSQGLFDSVCISVLRNISGTLLLEIFLLLSLSLLLNISSCF